MEPPKDSQPLSPNHLSEQLTPAIQTLLGTLPQAFDLVAKLQASPEHHEAFSQAPEATAKTLVGMKVPEGVKLTHDPEEKIVTMSSSVPSHDGHHHQEPTTININLNVSINNTANFAISGIPNHADINSPVGTTELA